MSILSNLFQQYQTISQNPVGAIRTPQQLAYDEMLNRQDQADKQAKLDNLATGLATGINGVGKIISSAVIKNPYEKAGATRRLDETDEQQQNLIKDWANKRALQRRNFVDEAKEQLALARQDEDKQYSRDIDTRNFEYKKTQDAMNNLFERDKFNWHIQNAENERKRLERQAKEDNKWKQIEEIRKNEERKLKKEELEAKNVDNEQNRQLKDLQIKKALQELDPELIQKQKDKEQYEKDLTEVNNLIAKKLVNASDGAFLVRHPEAYRELISRLPFSLFRGKFEVPSWLIEKYEQKAKGDTYNLGI